MVAYRPNSCVVDGWSLETCRGVVLGLCPRRNHYPAYDAWIGSHHDSHHTDHRSLDHCGDLNLADSSNRARRHHLGDVDYRCCLDDRLGQDTVGVYDCPCVVDVDLAGVDPVDDFDHMLLDSHLVPVKVFLARPGVDRTGEMVWL